MDLEHVSVFWILIALEYTRGKGSSGRQEKIARQNHKFGILDQLRKGGKRTIRNAFLICVGPIIEQDSSPSNSVLGPVMNTAVSILLGTFNVLFLGA